MFSVSGIVVLEQPFFRIDLERQLFKKPALH